MPLTPEQQQKLQDLENKEEDYWLDAMYEHEALTNLAYRIELVRTFRDKFGMEHEQE